MVVVTHNLLAANANRQLGITTDNKKKSSEKLSSGYRINRAADDAAGLSISEKLRYQIRGLQRGEKNTMDGVSWCQVGDGALQEIEDMVQRIRELAVQASNDTNTAEDRAAINEEVKQLRKEINQTSYNAMFNTQHIFDSKEASFGVMGVPDDLTVYTANTSIGTEQLPLSNGRGSIDVNTDNYGGLIFDGNRIPWGEIQKDMIDTADSPDTFEAGNYYWQDEAGERFFNIRVDEDGTSLPQYTREMTITADITKGIIVDGEVIPWSEVVDEEGISMSDATKHDGVWMFNYHGADVGFYLTGIEFMEDVVREISDPHKDRVSYSWEVPYTGAAPEQAVNAEADDKIIVTETMKLTLHDNFAYENKGEGYYFVGADKNGLWLNDAETGNEIPGSRKSWEYFFGPKQEKTWEEWAQGDELSKKLTYTYDDTDSPDTEQTDTHVSFTFDMSDITGLDDVIEGLNGMIIGGGTQTSYAISDSSPAGSQVSVSSSVRFSYEDEKTLGRDFDNQAYQLATGLFTFDETKSSDKATVILTNNADPSKTITLSADFEGISSASDLEARLMDGVANYIDKIIQKKTEQTLAGLDAQADENEAKIKNRYTTAVSASFTSLDEDGVYTGGVDSVINSTITYNHSDLIQQIQVTMAGAADGNYIKNADGSYSIRNPEVTYPTGTQFYALQVEFEKDGKIFADKDALLEDHTEDVMAATFGLEKDSAGVYRTDLTKNKATVALSPTDYTYTTLKGHELPNSANRSLFQSVVKKTPTRNGIYIQNSSNVGDAIFIEKFAMNTVELGLFAINTSDYEGAQRTIDACDYALSVVNDRRSIFGAAQNRLEHTYNNSTNAEENQQAAESRIRDTDMAKEMVAFSKHSILEQAGQSMLAQANQSTQGILSLIR